MGNYKTLARHLAKSEDLIVSHGSQHRVLDSNISFLYSFRNGSSRCIGIVAQIGPSAELNCRWRLNSKCLQKSILRLLPTRNHTCYQLRKADIFHLLVLAGLTCSLLISFNGRLDVIRTQHSFYIRRCRSPTMIGCI